MRARHRRASPRRGRARVGAVGVSSLNDTAAAGAPLRRVVVVGTSGSGKSTLAARLAAAIDGRYVDLDELNWGPNWTAAPVPEFRRRATAALEGERWVVAGNYSKLRDIVWGQAETLVWIDYPLPITLWRLLRRTLRRTLLREELWGGNHESLREQFASRDSLFLWAFKTHFRRRREYPLALASPEYAHLRVLRFRRPSDVERWLAGRGVS